MPFASVRECCIGDMSEYKLEIAVFCCWWFQTKKCVKKGEGGGGEEGQIEGETRECVHVLLVQVKKGDDGFT